MDKHDVSESHAMAMVLAVSLELSAAQWKVALRDGQREKPAIHAVSVADVVVTRTCACRGQLRGRPRRLLDTARLVRAPDRMPCDRCREHSRGRGGGGNSDRSLSGTAGA
jgi:hypothetical protein